MSLISKKDVAVGPGLFVAQAAAAITAGDLVAYDLTATGDARYYTVIKADTNSSTKQIALAGVARNTVTTAGDEVTVQHWGFCTSVNCASSAAAADPLVAGTTAGRADVFVLALTGNAQTLQDPGLVIGHAIGAEASNLCAAFLKIPRLG